MAPPPERLGAERLPVFTLFLFRFFFYAGNMHERLNGKLEKKRGASRGALALVRAGCCLAVVVFDGAKRVLQIL